MINYPPQMNLNLCQDLEKVIQRGSKIQNKNKKSTLEIQKEKNKAFYSFDYKKSPDSANKN